MDPTRAIWIKDPLGILADGAERGVVVQRGKIVELVPKGGQPKVPAAFFEAGDHVVLPGLINTPPPFLPDADAGAAGGARPRIVSVLQALYPVWARMTPEALDLGVTVAMSELLLSGCTTTTDHHYVFPAGLEEAVDIEVAAAERLGMRVLLTRGSMNRSQRDGGLPPDSVVQDEDTILADSARVVAKHHQRGEDAMVQIALAPCSPFSVTTSADARDRRPRRETRRPPAYPPRRDRGREPVLRADLRLPAAGLSRAMRLARCADLARARHSLQRRGNDAARPGRNHHQPLRLQQPGAGVGLLPRSATWRRQGSESGSGSTARPRTTPPI